MTEKEHSNEILTKSKYQLEDFILEIQRSIDFHKSAINNNVSKIEHAQKKLDAVNSIINNREMISDGKRIYIIRGKIYTKGKVKYRNHWFWYHLGRTDDLSKKTDDELKDIVKSRFLRIFDS